MNAIPCQHAKTPENTGPRGKCRICHRARELARYHARGAEQRRQRTAARRAKGTRARVRVVEQNTDVIALYRAERDRAAKQGKKVLERRSA